jgi:GNAT superfamily N-acetyltransferase
MTLMAMIERHRSGFTLSTDPARLQIEVIHAYLSRQSYWAQGRPLETVKHSIENSLCYGIYQIVPQGSEQQVAFARVVTDYATFAWLCDVFVLESHRGEGLGKWLVESVVDHPDLQKIRRILLATRDAHELYRNYGGFENLASPERWMARTKD